MKNDICGLRHLVRTIRFSAQGLKVASRETAFLHELILGLLNAICIYVVPVSLILKLFVVVLWFVIVCAELLNTAIEVIVDLVSPGYHELAGRAKDLGSAAVFCVLVAFFAVWAIIVFCLCKGIEI